MRTRSLLQFRHMPQSSRMRMSRRQLMLLKWCWRLLRKEVQWLHSRSRRRPLELMRLLLLLLRMQRSDFAHEDGLGFQATVIRRSGDLEKLGIC